MVRDMIAGQRANLRGLRLAAGLRPAAQNSFNILRNQMTSLGFPSANSLGAFTVVGSERKRFAITLTTALNLATITREVIAPPPRGMRNVAVFAGTLPISP
jgi:hypothetical protein